MCERIHVTAAPLGHNGIPVHQSEIDEEVYDGVLAVLLDDRVVRVVAWTRICVGATGTGESGSASQDWECLVESDGATGLCGLIASLPSAVKVETTRREATRHRHGVFDREAHTLGWQFMGDDVLASEALEMGIGEWLKEYC